MKYLLQVCAAFVALAGCSTDKLDTWSEKARVWFTDTTGAVYSFKNLPEETTELITEIPITVAGNVERKKREINVEVLRDKRNDATKYEILRPVVVEADSASAVLRVKITKTENLKNGSDTLNFVLRSSDELVVGLTAYLRYELVFTNCYSRPSWWNDYNMGAYSQEKHDVLFAVFGNDDDIRGETELWGSVDAKYNLWKLNKYCEEQGYTFRFERNK